MLRLAYRVNFLQSLVGALRFQLYLTARWSYRYE
jgi:hypothetical protein